MPNTLHPSIIPRLDPEYAAFHDEHIVHLPLVHELPWDPAVRKMPHVPGSSTPLTVGRVEDYHLSRCKVRVFTPEGLKPGRGWPVFIFFHGGKLFIRPIWRHELIAYWSHKVGGRSATSIPRVLSARICARVSHHYSR